MPDFLHPYYEKMAELSLEEGCLLWGGRVIIPRSLTTTILVELHREHQGASRMKAFARGHVWWRGMDNDVVHSTIPFKWNSPLIHNTPTPFKSAQVL